MFAQQLEAPHAKHQPAARTTRNQALEALRIISAYGIIAYHSGAPFSGVTYGGLIVFLILAPVADLRFKMNRIRSVGQLSDLLIIPWAFWLVIYGVRNIAMHRAVFATPNLLVGILDGTSAHLWFLPYIFLVLALINAIKQRVDPHILFWIFTIAAATLLVTVTAWRVPSLSWELPLPQWMHALPAVCIGIMFGLVRQVGKGAIASGLIVAGALLVAVSARLPGVGIPYAIGIISMAVAVSPFAEKLSASWSVQPVADCMLGVFLTHILWLEVVGKVVGSGNYLAVTLAFLAAFGTVFATRRFIPASKWVLG